MDRTTPKNTLDSEAELDAGSIVHGCNVTVIYFAGKELLATSPPYSGEQSHDSFFSYQVGRSTTIPDADRGI